MSARSLIGMLAGALLLSTGWNQPAVAELWMDSELPLTWQETLACPLVVVAKYESHQDKRAVLKVVEVLKGKHDPAQPLTVQLEHLYSVETRPVGWEADREKADDGIPRLCYKRQLMNPGDLIPVAVRSPEGGAGGEDDVQRCFELARQVRSGKTEQLNALLDITDRLFKKGQYYAALPALLDCESPVAREHLLSYIEKAKEGSVSRWTGERYYGQLTSILYALRANRELHGEIAVDLLRSKLLPMRKAGVESLQSAWQCDFDFDPAALEAERAKKLTDIEPLLRHLAAISEPQARAVLLAHSGVTVIGEPNESWLPTLIDAVGQAGNAAPHALRLVEVIAGEERARKFEHFPPEQRQRALRAYLQDLGKLAQ